MNMTNKDLQMKIEKLKEREASLKEMSLNASDMELKKKFHLELLKIQEEIQSIRTEMKLLNTPIQQLIPDIFEEKRAIPNSFLRGALFGIVKKGKRPTVFNEHIFSMSQYGIEFSGEYLDQNDLELWDSLIYLAKKRNVENELRISLYELCIFLGYSSDAPNNRKRILNRLDRLKFAMVKITYTKKIFAGNLISNYFIDLENDGKIVIIFDKFIGKLFVDKDFTIISIDIRKLIGDNQLARWLYNFYESHNNPIPFSITFIKELCRSEASLKEFTRMLKESLIIIKKAHISVGRDFLYEITYNGYLKVGKANTKTQNQTLLFK